MTIQKTRMNARGGAALRTITALVIVLVVGVGVAKIVPVYVRSYSLEDTIRTQAKFASVDRKSPDQVRAEILEKAKELKLPVTPNDVKVIRAVGGVAIQTSYTVPVDLYVYTVNLHFHFSADTATAY